MYEQKYLKYKQKYLQLKNILLISQQIESQKGGEKFKNDLGWYEGDVKDGMMDGKGKLIADTGKVYEGEFKNDKMEGKGKQTWDNGDVYEGDFINNMMHGNGKMTMFNGDFYEGEFRNDKMEGKGKQTLKIRKKVYEGEFKNNAREGKGKLFNFNGDIYEGEFLNDMIHGKGKYTWTSSKRFYEGDFKNSNMNGYGRLSFSNGDFFEGEFNNGTMTEGIGKQKLHDGSIFEGCFKKNFRDGKGKQTWSEVYIEGNWNNDKKNGEFILKSTVIPNIEKKLVYNNDILYKLDTSNVQTYIVSSPSYELENYFITILINLHGADIENTKCELNSDKHVRLLTPIPYNLSNVCSNTDVKTAFNIAYNVFNNKNNIEASTFQKMRKIIDIYNTNNPEFYDMEKNKALSRPIIDHLYEADKILNSIFIVDTNYFFDTKTFNFSGLIKKSENIVNHEDIQKFNIFDNLVSRFGQKERENRKFLRSTLINFFLNLGYNTINIIDLSCRNKISVDKIKKYYNQEFSSILKCSEEVNLESDFIGDDVRSFNF